MEELVGGQVYPGGLLGSDWGPEAPPVKGGAAKLSTRATANQAATQA